MTDHAEKLAEALDRIDDHWLSNPGDPGNYSMAMAEISRIAREALAAYRAAAPAPAPAGDEVERVRAVVAEGLYYGLTQVDVSLVPADLADSIARAAIAAMGSREGWRPIETAPKDGTAIRVLSRSGKQYVAVPHCKYSGWEKDPIDCMTWQCAPGHGATYSIHATHWRPLPAPPAHEGKG